MNIFKFLSIFLKSFTHKKVSYSYGGIDSIVNYIFKSQPNGIYIDVGCGHPIKNNNTYLLNKKGWSGINIDLDISNIELFNIYRPNDFNICTAISDVEKETNLYYYHPKSSINTIDKKTSEYQNAKVTAIKKIKTNTLNNILNSSKFESNTIDFLSVDVEGSELAVLKNFNFKKYKPKVIVIEFLDLTLKKLEIKNINLKNILNSNIYNLLISNDYNLVNILHSDLVFIHNDFKD